MANRFRPITLFRTIPKLLSACIAEDLCYLAEQRGLLPGNHFGGRPRRTTTDALHLLTQAIQNAWRKNKVVSVLFLDTAGAFPNAVPDILCHNMRTRGVPEGYVKFVERMLTGRRTKICFDDHETEAFDVDNGIGQGDPLSMILYLFYNADILDMTRASNELAIGYVDDLALIAIGDSFDQTHAILKEMMERHGGGCDWATRHNSPWEYDKTKVVDFASSTKRRHLDYQPRPLTVDGNSIENISEFKYLGIWLDRSLSFNRQAREATTKGARYVAQINRIIRTTRGLTGELTRRLYVAVAVPKMTYAADVWFTPIRNTGRGRLTGSIGFARRLATVQRQAAIKITGAMRTTAGDILDQHADLWPTRLLMDKICYRATLRLCTLPSNHPLHPLVKNASRRRSPPPNCTPPPICNVRPTTRHRRDHTDIPSRHEMETRTQHPHRKRQEISHQKPRGTTTIQPLTK